MVARSWRFESSLGHQNSLQSSFLQKVLQDIFIVVFCRYSAYVFAECVAKYVAEYVVYLAKFSMYFTICVA